MPFRIKGPWDIFWSWAFSGNLYLKKIDYELDPTLKNGVKAEFIPDEDCKKFWTANHRIDYNSQFCARPKNYGKKNKSR